ncbi:MAG: glycosyltransferase [Winogradskyella sp.]|uniref:glycosyltransferase n=1 Tax=Winogradskyella sp. TaxID=1883156 RepID=UPI001844A28C|nr:glycosyltransferase [Winogradskyella sp.]
MVSILIPIYNYCVTELLHALKLELDTIDCKYEILCCEDGSNRCVEENAKIISEIDHATHIISERNIGRIATRQKLAHLSKYDHLVFLDADVLPLNNHLISTYLKYFPNQYDAVYGGYYYSETKPNSNLTLRWRYGKNYEQVDAHVRNKKPYKIVISGNFLIKKQLFLDINSKIKSAGYGYDNYFGALLKTKKSSVLHINNHVLHNGLDTNAVYLKKIEKSVETIFELHYKFSQFTTDITLLEVFKNIDKLGISKLIAWMFTILKSSLKKQLLGSSPNLKLLQFYKLGYLCVLTKSR